MAIGRSASSPWEIWRWNETRAPPWPTSAKHRRTPSLAQALGRQRRMTCPTATERQERTAVRGSQGQRHVQGTGRANRQLTRSLEPGWQEVRFRRQLQAGWDDRAEEGGRAQRRQGLSEEESSK